ERKALPPYDVVHNKKREKMGRKESPCTTRPLARRRPCGSTDNRDQRRECCLSRISTVPVILVVTRPSYMHEMEKSKRKKRKRTPIFKHSLIDNLNL
ncbi:hypothetical protein VIGAN_11145600, partial [Vigna angularis var. angularis]